MFVKPERTEKQLSWVKNFAWQWLSMSCNFSYAYWAWSNEIWNHAGLVNRDLTDKLKSRRTGYQRSNWREYLEPCQSIILSMIQSIKRRMRVNRQQSTNWLNIHHMICRDWTAACIWPCIGQHHCDNFGQSVLSHSFQDVPASQGTAKLCFKPPIQRLCRWTLSIICDRFKSQIMRLAS